MKRMLMVGWWVLTALILWWGWYLRQINDDVMDHHADALIVYVMLFITFPAGMLLLMLVVPVVFGLDYLMGSRIGGGFGETAVFLLLFSAAGFWQWFFVLPRRLEAWKATSRRPRI